LQLLVHWQTSHYSFWLMNPTGNLDSRNAEMIYDLFAKLNNELGQQ
jgi:hypothetical protein